MNGKMPKSDAQKTCLRLLTQMHLHQEPELTGLDLRSSLEKLLREIEELEAEIEGLGHD